jgi:hypothetical protein
LIIFSFLVFAADVLANVKFVHEKKLIGSYFDQISLDTGCICFGVADTIKALEMVHERALYFSATVISHPFSSLSFFAGRRRDPDCVGEPCREPLPLAEQQPGTVESYPVLARGPGVGQKVVR